MRHRLAARLALAGALLLPGVAPTAGAQVGPLPADDQQILPRGVLRLRASTEFSYYDERFGRRGREPLFAGLTRASLGAAEIPQLGSIETRLRQLAASPTLSLSLGEVAVSADVSVTTVPIALELGVARRVTIGLMVPYVRTRTNVNVAANELAAGATAGINPALSDAAARARNRELLAQFMNASAELREALANCAASPVPACSDPEAAREMAALADAFALGVAQLYGTAADTARGAPFVPLSTAPAQRALQDRIAAYDAMYRAALGSDVPLLTVTPTPATVPIGSASLQRVLTDPAFGIGAAPLESVRRDHVGDIEAGGAVLLFDGSGPAPRRSGAVRRLRGSLGAVVRVGTGRSDSPGNLLDVPTGDGQTDLELRPQVDIVHGALWATLGARYTWQLPDRQEMRIRGEAEHRFPEAFRQQVIDRDLGDMLELEVHPRYRFGEYFHAGAEYRYRRKGADAHRGTFRIDSAVTGSGDLVLDAAMLDAGTERREHRLGLSFTYSTIAAFERGTAWLPVEAGYLHSRTVAGAGRTQPVISVDAVRVRLYTRVLGGPRRDLSGSR